MDDAEFEAKWWPGARPGRPPVLVATSYSEAWELHRTHEGRYSNPMRINDHTWWVYPSPSAWPELGLGAEYPYRPDLIQEARFPGRPSLAPPSPGSSAEKAKLHDGDRQRISDLTAKRAEKRRKKDKRSTPDPAPATQRTVWE